MRPRVLVVEDEPDIAALLAMCFDPSRYQVAAASDLATARAVLSRRLRLHLAVVDLLLPDGNGLDFCRELKATRPSVPVIVLTAWVHAGTREEVLAAGADLFVPKPFEPDELEAAAQRLLKTGPRRGGRTR